MRKTILLILFPVALLLCGCPKRAEYARPALPVPESWAANSTAFGDEATTAAASSGAVAADLKWNEFLADEKLRAIIKMTLENNRDLLITALNIEKAQTLYRIQGAERRPTVGASATGNVNQIPFGDDSRLTQQYNVSLGVSSWELDFFDRIKSLKSRALEQYLATEQARSATQISLVASV
ncbi:MAG: TolC family protein, partial [Acidobacteriota bacterium]|nr:TolC family protein [Acidobacteriota bacterium]